MTAPRGGGVAGRGTVRRGGLFGPIRVRLALIVLIAAVPLLMLSATIAWQNYRLALDVTAQTVARLREAAVARHMSALSGAEQMMQALAQVAELSGSDTAACPGSPGQRAAAAIGAVFQHRGQ